MSGGGQKRAFARDENPGAEAGVVDRSQGESYAASFLRHTAPRPARPRPNSAREDLSRATLRARRQ